MSRLAPTGEHWYSLTMSRRDWCFWLGIAYAVLTVIMLGTPPLMYLLKIGGY